MFFRALFDFQKLFPWADKCICKTKLQTAPTEGPTAGFPSKSQTWMTGRRQPASKTKPEIPHLRSAAEGIELKIPRSKSQIEEPKLKCSHFIYLTCNHNDWDQLIVETSLCIYVYNTTRQHSSDIIHNHHRHHQHHHHYRQHHCHNHHRHHLQHSF